MSTLDLAATLAAAEASTVALVDRRDVVLVAGPGAVAYLQGQVSQNVERLAVGTSADTFLLDPQGHIDGWFRLTRLADDTVACDTEPGLGERLEARLRRFWLRVDAELTSDTWDRLAIVGPDAPADLQAPEGGFVVSRTDGGVDLVGPAVEAPDGVPVGDPDVLETLRIRSARPRIDLDAVERTIPAELGVVDQSADFTKGCYVGQELVARVDSRGNNTPRRLLVFRAGGPVVPGAEVAGADGTTVGTVTSVGPEPEGVVLFASIKRGVDPADGLTVDGIELRASES